MQNAVNGVAATSIEGVVWRKSRHSNAAGQCVEVAVFPAGGAALRNSRDPQGPALVYTQEEMRAFVLGVKEGEFDCFLA
ncbi:DUF397 domain-containing protein [Streptomyces carpaticus]|uniref:DUF397 domain-containing protein n=1 Tax=Streptomyces carpaticus TaxID=285558 RepID=UPI0031F82D9F